jgi:hypothetical protein
MDAVTLHDSDLDRPASGAEPRPDVDLRMGRSPRQLEPHELEAGLAGILASPSDGGTLELIVRRPMVNRRELLDEAELATTAGMVGDSWSMRGSTRTSDGTPHPDMQLNLINARVARLVAGDDPADRALAGDQLHVDLELSPENLPTGTRLAIGTAVIEVTEQPHTGCPKFSARYGPAALRFVNTGRGKELRLRGINAKVVTDGTIRAGDTINKLDASVGDG